MNSNKTNCQPVSRGKGKESGKMVECYLNICLVLHCVLFCEEWGLICTDFGCPDAVKSYGGGGTARVSIVLY